MTEHELALTLVALGGLLLAGLGAEWLGRRTRVPGVTLLVILGVLAGPSGLSLLPAQAETWMPILSTVALTMIGFLLGHHFTLQSLRQRGAAVLVVSLVVTAATFVLVTGGLWAVGLGLAPALLLGAVATATDPATTVSVLDEARADGPFSKLLLGVVAVDDVWGLLLFSIATAGATLVIGGDSVWSGLYIGLWEAGGGVLLGLLLGAPMALLTGRLSPGEPTRLEALGFVLLCGGLARWFEVSYLLAAVVMGAVVANLASHHERPFDAIEHLDRPFLVAFFVLAGASLDFSALGTVGIGLLAFVALRFAGRIVGGLLGGSLAGSPPLVRRWIGLALLPQAGVALGLALLVADRFPDLAPQILPIVVAGTILFELAGPLTTRFAVARTGEVGQGAPEEEPA